MAATEVGIHFLAHHLNLPTTEEIDAFKVRAGEIPHGELFLRHFRQRADSLQKLVYTSQDPIERSTLIADLPIGGGSIALFINNGNPHGLTPDRFGVALFVFNKPIYEVPDFRWQNNILLEIDSREENHSRRRSVRISLPRRNMDMTDPKTLLVTDIASRITYSVYHTPSS